MSIAIATTTVTFTSGAGDPVDCTEVWCDWYDPSGNMVRYNSPDHDGTGQYSQTVTIDEPGKYTAEWYGKIANGLERKTRSTTVVK